MGSERGGANPHPCLHCSGRPLPWGQSSAAAVGHVHCPCGAVVGSKPRPLFHRSCYCWSCNWRGERPRLRPRSWRCSLHASPALHTGEPLPGRGPPRQILRVGWLLCPTATGAGARRTRSLSLEREEGRGEEGETKGARVSPPLAPPPAPSPPLRPLQVAACVRCRRSHDRSGRRRLWRKRP